MAIVTVTESVDIRAPLPEVWEVIGNYEKRMYLSPLWEVVSIEPLTPGPYGPGSRYRVHMRRNEVDIRYESQVVDFEEGRRIVHQLTVERGTRTTWRLLDCAVGTRLMYEDAFEAGNDAAERALIQAVHQNTRWWLEAIKDYVEWGHHPVLRIWRRIYDRFLLKLPPMQKRLITFILFLELITISSFICVTLFLGIVMKGW